jgi:hypothetical protein
MKLEKVWKMVIACFKVLSWLYTEVSQVVFSLGVFELKFLDV